MLYKKNSFVVTNDRGYQEEELPPPSCGVRLVYPAEKFDFHLPYRDELRLE